MVVGLEGVDGVGVAVLVRLGGAADRAADGVVGGVGRDALAVGRVGPEGLRDAAGPVVAAARPAAGQPPLSRQRVLAEALRPGRVELRLTGDGQPLAAGPHCRLPATAQAQAR